MNTDANIKIDLPNDMIYEIMSFVPYGDMYRLRVVCSTFLGYAHIFMLPRLCNDHRYEYIYRALKQYSSAAKKHIPCDSLDFDLLRFFDFDAEVDPRKLRHYGDATLLRFNDGRVALCGNSRFSPLKILINTFNKERGMCIDNSLSSVFIDLSNNTGFCVYKNNYHGAGQYDSIEYCTDVYGRKVVKYGNVSRGEYYYNNGFLFFGEPAYTRLTKYYLIDDELYITMRNGRLITVKYEHLCTISLMQSFPDIAW